VCIRILLLLIFGFITITYADSAIQTDWSGGPGVWGPVTEWSDQFHLDINIEWGSILGDIVLTLIVEHTIDYDSYYPSSVYSKDIDGDGDMDVLCANIGDDQITWWENTDGSGTSWVKHIVDSDFNGARFVISEDIDGDGDMDILGAAVYAADISWWENLDGSGTSWAEHTIYDDFDYPIGVYSEDFDGDGDMDVLGGAYFDHTIIWWENLDGSGTSFATHVITDYDAVRSVYSEDIDGDGDMDVLSYAEVTDIWADDIAWWENSDGSGTSWVYHLVDNTEGQYHVFSQDIDGDGDMDILGVADAGKVVWWENLDGAGTSWTEHTIDGEHSGSCIRSEDLDDDGDMDVLSASPWADDITWWENEDGSGTSWTEHTIAEGFEGANSIYSEDIDGDGDVDVLGTAYYDHDITWWDLSEYSPSGMLESSVLDTQESPDWDYLEWSFQAPPGTSVSFQVRASDDHTVMGAWSDILLAPCLLNGVLNDGDRYLQYRAILETSDADTTPTLNDVTITWDPVSIGDTTEPIPPGIALLPIAPNPIAGSPVIRFGLPEPASVDISIFDLSGRLISEIHGDDYSPGYHDVVLRDLSPGVYSAIRGN